ncbi:tripartite motif-containing protein 10-like [Podarcis raffonei]|uniref:tripartite motif-containing protein 10-like n=1 Tax=Podarcis raffonei TaxID=65483 RepID=UPI00232939CC|nr:tripartite motif-containing protein 10-like [Podarcis raffonei]
MGSSSSTDIREEATCPICKEYLTDPVTVDCGHNFCRDCIVKYFDTWEPMQVGDLECPVCKARMQRGSFRPNWQLGNIVEKIKFTAPNKGGNYLCKRHKEKLHLFCKEDEELVCFVCERSPEHKSHTIVLKEEVAQEYKTLICDRLEHLKKEREKILAYEAKLGEESNSLLKLTETERQKTMEKFRQLHQFLEEQEKRLLNEIEEMEKEITRRREEHLARLSDELSSLERSIREMEEKSQQPASELLQDIRRTLQRYEQKGTSENPPTFPTELKRKISKFWIANPILYVEMEEIKDALLFGLHQKGNVTLDPDTAHPILSLSEDQKSVRLENKPQILPNNPERFSNGPCVLGREGFTAGRHFWEVNVGSEQYWVLGVARRSVRRRSLHSMRGHLDHFHISSALKLKYDISPEGGIWAVGKWECKYWACTSPDYFLLPLSEEPKRIQVSLDYEGGRVSFSDADSGVELYTFSGTSFSGETLLPYFFLWGSETHLRISS